MFGIFYLSNQKQIPYSNVTLSSNLGLFHQLAGQPKVASTTYSLLLLVLHLLLYDVQRLCVRNSQRAPRYLKKRKGTEPIASEAKIACWTAVE